MKRVSSKLKPNLAPAPADKAADIGNLLYEMELFEGLAPAELAAAFDEAEVRTYAAGSLIFMPEDPSSERMYVLKDGKVNLYLLTANGKRLVTRQILPGSTFGVRALLARVTQENFAEAVEDSTVCIMTSTQCRAFTGNVLIILTVSNVFNPNRQTTRGCKKVHLPIMHPRFSQAQGQLTRKSLCQWKH